MRVPDSLLGNGTQGVEVVSPYKNFNLVTRALRKFFGNTALIQNVINNPKLKGVDADLIIVFDTISPQFLQWLKKHNPNTRIVLWYWNPVFLTISPSEVPDGIEKWSYSRTDCERYGMTFNTQFCFDQYEPNSNGDWEWDIFFFGRDKGRGELLEAYRREFEAAGFSTNFQIIQSQADFRPYQEVIEWTKKCKCVLDFCVNDEAGMSLRALEALFLNKKVITNNKMYVYEEFYSPQNVFILGVDRKENLKEFMNAPLEEIGRSVKERYLFENWLERFYC